MKTRMLVFAVATGVSVLLSPSSAAGRQFLHGHVPEAIARFHLQPIGRLPATNRLHLAIGLPLRNKEALTNLLEQLYDPTSINYHRYLSPHQFTEEFGPSEQDYQAVLNFAKANGLMVTRTYFDRTLVDVDASVSNIERTFHLTMGIYRHPTENRLFYAPDVGPSLDLAVPVLEIIGLNNYSMPHPMIVQNGINAGPMVLNDAEYVATGSGTNGSYWGWDFRNAYLGPNVTLLGTGQSVGLLEFGGYSPSDILAYENAAGIPYAYQASNPINLTNINVDGFNGTSSNSAEVSLDIEMAICMAPGLSNIVIYEASPTNAIEAQYGFLFTNFVTGYIHILNCMATNVLAKQLSSSMGWSYPMSSAMADQYFQQFIAQGQSFFQASADNGAYASGTYWPLDDPYVTVVGGTSLTTTGTNTIPWNAYVGESTWSSSGGGISSNYTIPPWQQGVDMSNNGGSVTMRNIPDVAMVADNILITVNGTYRIVAGTSAAAPLWAGFTALVNQQLALENPTNSVGFLNTALYRIGKNPPISGSPFHDITTGNNTNSRSPNAFYAVRGYDLCTGWGTPNGTNLINALVAMPPIITNQPQNENVAVGGTAIFSIGVTGSQPFSYQWYWNDASHPLRDGGNISGSLSNNLTISDVQTTNAGTYYVVISNPSSSITSTNAVLTVYVTVPTSTITFDNLPNSSGGSSVSNGYEGLNWGNFYYLNGLTNSYNPSGYKVGVISPNNVVFNGSGNAANITSPSLPFDFISAYLTAAWNDSSQLKVLGFTGSTITYSNIYMLNATNATEIIFDYLGVTEVYFASSGGTHHAGYGGTGEQFAMDNVTVTTNLAVETPPQIVTQPTNQISLPGASVLFTVSATGTAPLSYQWLKDGNPLFDAENISGSATSSLTVSNVSTSDVGTYSAIASNPYGSVVSTDAVLSVYVAGSPFLITFDDLVTTNTSQFGVPGNYDAPIPGGYNGLNWNNFWVVNVAATNSGGYLAGIISPDNVAFNEYANPASITSVIPFDFLSAYLTAAWNDNLQVEVLGYMGSTVTYSNNYTLSATAPTFINFNYLGVNEVYFVSSGGTHHSGYSYNGEHFAMDNVTISTNLAVSVLPTVQTMAESDNTITLGFAAMVGQTYQVQYTTNLAQTNWNNLGAPIIATTSTIYVQDSITNSQRFYRIVLLP